MYADFSVTGFRGLGRLRIDRLTPVTVVTGRNGVGKTALLEAMFLHACGPAAAANALVVLRPMRGLKPMTRGLENRVNAPWAPFFADRDPDAAISLEAQVDGEARRVRLSAVPSFVQAVSVDPGAGGQRVENGASLDVEISTDGGESLTYRHFALLNADDQIVRFESNPPVVGPLYPVRIIKGVGAIDTATAYSDLRRQGRDSELVAALSAVDPRISDVELLISEGLLTPHARLRDGRLVPFSSLGDGVNHTTVYLLAAGAADGGLILIDELEEGLHHSAFPGVWRQLVTSARRSGTQLVVTTHSEDAIAGVVEAMEDRLDELSLVRLRDTSDDLVQAAPEERGPVAAVIYSGPQVAGAIELPVEVR